MISRITQLHKTENDWNKYSSFVPEKGELIVYDPDANYAYSRLKVGDGKHTLAQLDFIIEAALDELLNSVKFNDIIDGGRITENHV